MTVYVKVHFPSHYKHHSFVLQKSDKRRDRPIEFMVKNENGRIVRRRRVKRLAKDLHTVAKIVQYLNAPSPGIIARFVVLVLRKADSYPVETDLSHLERSPQNLQLFI